MSIAHTAPISGVAAYGRFIATAGYDNQVILWDADSHVALSRGCHDHLANQCEFSPDGTMLVSAGSDRSARVWSLPEMRLVRVLAGHSDDVIKASFSPDGRFIATCAYDHTLMVYDLAGAIRCVCHGHTGLIETFDWAPDSRSFVSCGTDGTVKRWSAETGEILQDVSGFEHDVDALVVTTSEVFFVGSDDGTIVGLHGAERSVTHAHRAGVKKLVSRGEMLLSLGYDQQCVLWKCDRLTLTEVARSTFPSHIWARSAAFIDEANVVFGTFGSTYAVWNWVRGNWNSDGYTASLSLNAVRVGRDGMRYTIGDAGTVFREHIALGGPGSLCNCLGEVDGRMFTGGQLGIIYEATTGEPMYSGSAPINCVTSLHASSSALLVFGTYKGSLLVFNSDGHELCYSKTLDLDCNAIKGICHARGLLFCGSADGTLTILDARSLGLLHSIRGAHDGILNGVAAYNGGFASISRDRTLRLWDDSGRCQGVIASRHKHSIKCVATDSTGSLIATGSYGGTIDVYSISAGAWMDRVERPTTSGISSLAWDEVRARFVASSYDGRLYEVHASSGSQARELCPQEPVVEGSSSKTLCIAN